MSFWPKKCNIRSHDAFPNAYYRLGPDGAYMPSHSVPCLLRIDDQNALFVQQVSHVIMQGANEHGIAREAEKQIHVINTHHRIDRNTWWETKRKLIQKTKESKEPKPTLLEIWMECHTDYFPRLGVPGSNPVEWPVTRELLERVQNPRALKTLQKQTSKELTTWETALLNALHTNQPAGAVLETLNACNQTKPEWHRILAMLPDHQTNDEILAWLL